MEQGNSLKKPKEYQTVGLFAILAMMTLMTVLLFKVVLFAPQDSDKIRNPSNENETQAQLLNLQTDLKEKKVKETHK